MAHDNFSKKTITLLFERRLAFKDNYSVYKGSSGWKSKGTMNLYIIVLTLCKRQLKALDNSTCIN